MSLAKFFGKRGEDIATALKNIDYAGKAEQAESAIGDVLGSALQSGKSFATKNPKTTSAMGGAALGYGAGKLIDEDDEDEKMKALLMALNMRNGGQDA